MTLSSGSGYLPFLPLITIQAFADAVLVGFFNNWDDHHRCRLSQTMYDRRSAHQTILAQYSPAGLPVCNTINK